MPISKIERAGMATGAIIQVQNNHSPGPVYIANSGSGRIYSDLLSVSFTPTAASGKLVLIGTSGFSSFSATSTAGAFGIVFDVNGTPYEVSNYPWYSAGIAKYPGYPPETTIARTFNMPTGSPFTIKLRGFSYNESNGTMTPQFINYSLTVMEVSA